jgi:predicted nucleotidyltransferase
MKPSEALAAHRTALRKLFILYGLERPRVYGSVLSGTDTEESDLDLLADATETTTLFTLARLEYAAHELLGVRVSILTPEFLPEKFRGRVLERAQPL